MPRRDSTVSWRTKLPDVKDAILKYVSLGIPIHVACSAAGITKVTFYEWKKRGAKGDEPFASFCEELEVADAKAEIVFALNVRKAAFEAVPGQWQAGMTYMERRWPEDWTRQERSQVELSGRDGGPIQYGPVIMIPPERPDDSGVGEALAVGDVSPEQDDDGSSSSEPIPAGDGSEPADE